MTKDLKGIKEETVVAEKAPFRFPTGKVVISLIEKRFSTVVKDPNETDRYTGTKSTIKCPVKLSTGEIDNPLTQEEQEAIETALQYEKGTLNPYKPAETNFYSTSKGRIVLHKVDSKPSSMDRILDKSVPYEYLLYKIALKSPIVAKSWETRFDREEYQYVMKDLDAELKEELTLSAKEDTVWEYLIKNKLNKKKLYDLLRLVGVERVGIKIDINSQPEFLSNELKKLVKESRANLDLIYTIIELSEEQLSGKVLLLDGISTGLIKKSGNLYKKREGQLLGSTEADAINELLKDENQDLKLLIVETVKRGSR